MPKKRKRENLSDNCRVCLYNDDNYMADIFSSELHPKIKELADSAAIDIKDEDDGLPRNICHVCLYKLEMWCDFKAQFVKTNTMLLQLLENSELSDTMMFQSKRKLDDSQLSQEERRDDLHDMKKLKLDTPPSMAMEFMENDCESQESRIFGENPQAYPGTTSESQPLQKLSPSTKNRQLGMRRTTEQRLASTQRWEARKKALRAATGENDSDSDSIASDDTELSPIQKARAKSVGQKDLDWQKHSGKAVNNLTATQPDLFSTNLGEKPPIKELHNNEVKEVSNKSEVAFEQQTIQSELSVGDCTYVVTSVLVVENSQTVNEPTLNNLPKVNKSDDSNQEMRTDIFDAVQLRRVKPIALLVPNSTVPSKRILNAQIEGTDVESLRRVQKEIANFIETDMKTKLLKNAPTEKTKVEMKPIQPTHTLEQKVKLIIENSLKKDHLQNSKTKTDPNSRLNKSFSVAFIKAAMKSQIFQPKVILNRVEVDHSNPPIDSHNHNISEVLETKEVLKISSNTNLEEGNDLVDFDSSQIFGFEKENHQLKPVGSEPSPEKRSDSSPKKTVHPSILAKVETEIKKEDIDIKQSNKKKINRKESNKKNIDIQKSKEEIVMEEIHQDHKEMQKKMRCKKCSEVVQAKLVKNHVCRKRNSFSCDFCNSQFRSNNMLARHLRTHEDQVKIERVPNLAHQTIDVQQVSLINDEPVKQDTFQCFVCDKPFESEKTLENHLREHRNVPEEEPSKEKEIFQCAICGDALSSGESLEKHVEKHLFHDEDDTSTSTEISKNNVSESKVEPEIELHVCDLCQKQFDTSLDLLLHIQVHEEDLAIAEWEKQLEIDSKRYFCTTCEESFQTESELADHSSTHIDGIHECQVCEMSFVSFHQLQEHINTHFI